MAAHAVVARPITQPAPRKYPLGGMHASHPQMILRRFWFPGTDFFRDESYVNELNCQVRSH
jgi:hypothetical protein